MVVSGSRKRWYVAYNPPEGKDYKYISGIFPANWGMDYATYHPTFYGNHFNNHRLDVEKGPTKAVVVFYKKTGEIHVTTPSV